METHPAEQLFQDPEVSAAWAAYQAAIQAEVEYGLITADAAAHLCNAWGMAAWYRSYLARQISL